MDHMDALAALDAAYQLLLEFEKTIEANEGDHPMAQSVDRWLTAYEKVR